MIRILIFGLLLVSFGVSWGQRIESIQLTGLHKTKEVYVRQFLTVKVGDVLDSVKLESDRKILTNLEIFSHAQFKVEELESGGYDIVFWCNELFTLLPIFSFGGIEENFWVQVGGSEVNLSGKGHKLTAYYQYYDRSSFAMHATFQRIKQSKWGANFNLIKWSTLEPVYFSDAQVTYEYDNWTIGGEAIRYFNFQDRLEVGGALFTEDYTKVTDQLPEAPAIVNKEKLLGKVRWIVDHVNYFYFYQSGNRNQLNVQSVYSLNNDPAFYIVFNDFYHFRRFGLKGNLGIRWRMGLSTNEESPFAPFVLDSYLNIRGIGNRVDRGTGALILNAEYRHAFLDKEKMAIQGVVFSDSGSWRNPGGEFSDFTNEDNFVLFGGLGMRFIHKKIFNAILRVDYGFDLQDTRRNGFVLGIGQYF